MQRAWLIPVLVAATVASTIAVTQVSTRRADAGVDVRVAAEEKYAGPTATDDLLSFDGTSTRLVGLDAYVDPDFGFSIAVPAGWTPVVAAETDAELAMLEPGYAVGFESPLTHDRDVFSDYLMVEIMPADDHGLFETDGRERRETRIDGRPAWRDALTLPADGTNPATVDLIVRQATMSGLGFTVGLYAVGEPARLPLLEDAFEAMLRTFRLPRAPFSVS